MEFTITWRELLIGLILAVGFYLLEVAVFARVRKRPRPSAKAGEADDLRDAVAALRNEVAWLAARLGALEERTDASPRAAPVMSAASAPKPLQPASGGGPRPPPRLGPRPEPPPVSTPYTLPVQYAREGLSAQEIASRCGISRGEAELLIALHRTDRPAS